MERQFRVVMYSHDGLGIGHFRRNLLIAQHLIQAIPAASVLLVAGAGESAAFGMPAGIDCLTLPALRKSLDGSYSSRRLRMCAQEILRLRSDLIAAAVEAFEPDLLVVDKLPRGVGRELEPTLQVIRARGRTRCVLGLRDILDDALAVRAEWKQEENELAIEQFYDAVWVYGDRTVCDPVLEYGFGAAVAGKTRFAGYIERLSKVQDNEASSAMTGSAVLPEGRVALCMVGGGEDGGELAQAFAHADLPVDMTGMILSGPFMPSEVRKSLHMQALRRQQKVRVLDFTTTPEWLLRAADRVVTMGGYNAVCETLCAGKRALVVPRAAPRREQWIRAQRLHRLGLIDVLDPEDLAAESLSAWLALPTERPAVEARDLLDFGGLSRIPQFVQELCGLAPAQAFAPLVKWYGAMDVGRRDLDVAI